jgi:hypothetical protein
MRSMKLPLIVTYPGDIAKYDPTRKLLAETIQYVLAQRGFQSRIETPLGCGAGFKVEHEICPGTHLEFFVSGALAMGQSYISVGCATSVASIRYDIEVVDATYIATEAVELGFKVAKRAINNAKRRIKNANTKIERLQRENDRLIGVIKSIEKVTNAN